MLLLCPELDDDGDDVEDESFIEKLNN